MTTPASNQSLSPYSKDNIIVKAIEASHLPFALVDMTTESRYFSYVSQAFCDLSGHSTEKLLASNFNIFTGPDTPMGELDALDSAMKQGMDYATKILHYRQDGSSFWNHMKIFPVFDDEDKDKIVAYAILFEDMTEALKREKNEIARQRNESLGMLAGSVAHEINNLLMPMTMAKDILEDELKEDCDPFAHVQLDKIVEYAEQAKAIVSGILTFTRKQEREAECVKIRDVTLDAVHFAESLIRQNATLDYQNIENNTDMDDVLVMINPTEYKQIITNLSKNAEHAMGNESGVITLSFDQSVLSNTASLQLNIQPGMYVVITFADTGKGIPKDVIDKIFDPLFTTKDIGEGTGLGLSVVHGILVSWGGAITVDSEEDKGTTFKLYIPVYKAEDDHSDLADIVDEDSDEDGLNDVLVVY